MGFDLDCVTVGYDGSDVLALPRAVSALTLRQNRIDPTRQSTTYERRLYKVGHCRVDGLLQAHTNATTRRLSTASVVLCRCPSRGNSLCPCRREVATP